MVNELGPPRAHAFGVQFHPSIDRVGVGAFNAMSSRAQRRRRSSERGGIKTLDRPSFAATDPRSHRTSLSFSPPNFNSNRIRSCTSVSITLWSSCYPAQRRCDLSVSDRSSSSRAAPIYAQCSRGPRPNLHMPMSGVLDLHLQTGRGMMSDRK